MNKKKVAVTGAAGQVGSVIVKHLAAMPDIEPVAICRNPINAGILHSTVSRCTIRIGSITEEESARKVMGDCDVIIHCALAMVSGKPKLSRTLNKNMIANIAGLNKINMLIHLSSISVYGSGLIQEKKSSNMFENPPADNDYGRSKLFIENFAAKMCGQRKLKYYTLRLGHVIGANMDRSRQIFGLASDRDFRLPFDGRFPSNTIHVERLAAMIAALIAEPVPVGVYNVTDMNSSWRQIFDWHTETAGLTAVQGMSQDQSASLQKYFANASLCRDVKSWIRSMPFLSIVRYPSIFEYASRVVAIAPQIVTDRFVANYKRIEIGRQIADLIGNDYRKTGSVYIWDAMPGKYLVIPSNQMHTYPNQESLNAALRDWHAQFMFARWLPDHIFAV